MRVNKIVEINFIICVLILVVNMKIIIIWYKIEFNIIDYNFLLRGKYFIIIFVKIIEVNLIMIVFIFIFKFV